MSKILLVEDDTSTQILIRELLLKAGHQVTINATGNGVIALLDNEQPPFDLVICDIVLPEGDGLEITREISVFNFCPVLLISTKNEDFDRIVGLAQGADDYLAKPFNPMELLLRIQVILRRHGKTQNVILTEVSQSIIKVSPKLDLHLETRTLINDCGKEQVLTDGEHQLLIYLIGNRGKLCHRKQLYQHLNSKHWTPSDRSLDVLVGRLRKKLNDDPLHPRCIITLRGKGYMLVSL